MKPMLKYRGGKQREIPEILPYVPKEYGRYVEPFFGGGSLFFHLEPAAAIINDLNQPLMSFYQGVRDDFDSLSKELQVFQENYEANRVAYEQAKAAAPDERVDDSNEADYYLIRNMFNHLSEPKYSEAALYFYLNKTAYSGMIRYNRSGEYNVPYGRYKHLNASCVTEDHARLLRKATLMVGDYNKVFELCNEDDFVFLDPPYDCVFSDYGNPELGGAFSEVDHEKLAQAFYELPSKALMVIGLTNLTERLYKDSIVHEYAKSYAVNIRNRFKSAGKHILVKNREWE